MARDFYETTIGTPDGTGKFVVLENVRVSVFARDTTDLVSIFQRETGAAGGPSPEAGAVGATNPFITGDSGSVQFWCNAPGRCDILVEDTTVPARIAPRTIQWNAKVTDDPRVFQTVHSFAIAGLVQVSADANTDIIPPIYIPVVAGQVVKLAKIFSRIVTGNTVTFTVKRNGADVPGAVGLTAPRTFLQVDDIVDVTLADRDQIQIVVTAVSSGVGADPYNLTVGLVLEHAI